MSGEEGEIPIARVNGISLNYNVEGQGEPIILIMGCGGPGRAWFFQIRVFKKHYKVVTFDARDAAFGKTDNPKRTLYYEDDGG